MEVWEIVLSEGRFDSRNNSWAQSNSFSKLAGFENLGSEELLLNGRMFGTENASAQENYGSQYA